MPLDELQNKQSFWWQSHLFHNIMFYVNQSHTWGNWLKKSTTVKCNRSWKSRIRSLKRPSLSFTIGVMSFTNSLISWLACSMIGTPFSAIHVTRPLDFSFIDWVKCMNFPWTNTTQASKVDLSQISFSKAALAFSNSCWVKMNYSCKNIFNV